MANYELQFSEACFKSCPKIHNAICAELGRQAMGLVNKDDKFASLPDLRIAISETFEDDPSFIYQQCDGPLSIADDPRRTVCGRGFSQ